MKICLGPLLQLAIFCCSRSLDIALTRPWCDALRIMIDNSAIKIVPVQIGILGNKRKHACPPGKACLPTDDIDSAYTTTIHYC